MRKVFRPLSAETNEKQFIGDDEPIQDGWFTDPQQSLRSWVPRRGPGRPRRVVDLAEPVDDTFGELAEE